MAREVIFDQVLTPAQQKCQDILTTPFSRWQFLLLRLDRSRDVKFVRQQVAIYLLDAIKLAPPTMVNIVFQTLFRLIREDDRVTKNLVVDAIRALATKYPKRIPEVISDLKRLNRKERVATLDDLIREFRSSQKRKRNRIRDEKRDRNCDETHI